MGLFESVGAWFKKASPARALPIPAASVSPPPPKAGAKAVARQHYLRFSVDQTLLAGKEWTRTVQPLVAGAVRTRAGGQVFEVPFIFDSSRLGGRSVGGADTIVGTFRVSPLLPFRGGDVDLQIGLFAVKTADYLATATKVCASLASVFLGPEVAPLVKLATPLVAGIQELVQEEDVACRLAYTATFDASTLVDGYIGVLRDTGDGAPVWSMHHGEWRFEGARGPEPVRGHDGFLLRVEVMEDRDDWAAIPSIEQPFQEALRAVRDGEDPRADAALRLAVAAALKSPDLTEAHRRLVVEEMKAAVLAEKKLATSGAAPRVSAIAGLSSLVGGASVANAVRRGPITDEEATAGWPFEKDAS